MSHILSRTKTQTIQTKTEKLSVVSGIAAGEGVWLLASPLTLHYADSIAKYNDLWVGMIIIFIALMRVFSPSRTIMLSYVNAVLGIWLMIAPFIFIYWFSPALWNDVIVGITLAIVSFTAAVTEKNYMQRI